MGKPKALLPIGGELMLQRIVRLVSEVVSPIVVVAAPKQELPPLTPAIELAHDAVEGRGPLQAIAAGLDVLMTRCDAVFVTSCDAPFLKPAFVRRLIDLIGSKSICVPYVDGFYHPLASVYRTSVKTAVQRLLNADRLRLLDLFELAPTRFVTADELTDIDPGLQSLRNLNSPDDYDSALRDSTSPH